MRLLLDKRSGGDRLCNDGDSVRVMRATLEISLSNDSGLCDLQSLDHKNLWEGCSSKYFWLLSS